MAHMACASSQVDLPICPFVVRFCRGSAGIWLANCRSLCYLSAEMHSSRDIDWEDLRMVLAVADGGSVAAAARILDVNHTTVLRRVNAFEKRLGIRLFDRLPTGYALTAGGEELLGTARKMAETVNELARKLSGQDLRFEGTLRVTTTDTLMVSVLPPILAAFRDLHPGIRVEATTQNSIANLTHRDADVAIRPVSQPQEILVGRRIAGVAFAAYAAPSYVETLPPEPGFGLLRWIAPDDSLANTGVARWMRSSLPDADIVFRADSLVTMSHAARAGTGVAVLPCYLGDSASGLVRVGGLIEEIGSALWVLVHDDLRRTARVHAFTKFVSDALQQRRDLLEGRLGTAAQG